MRQHLSVLFSFLVLSCFFCSAHAQKPKAKAAQPAKKPAVKASKTTSQKGWSVPYRDGFVDACKDKLTTWGEDSASRYCNCMAAKLEVLYPNERGIETMSQDQMVELANECLNKKGVIKSWTDKDREEFTSKCVETAVKTVGEQKAKGYCDCMLKKIEVVYPNTADLGKMTQEQIQKWAGECNKD